MKRPSLPSVRRGIQIGLAVVMAALPLANARGFNHINGNYLALEVFGLPFGDPLAAAQVLASARDIAWTGALGAALALAVALILGPVFCAYACPYGLFSEWVHRLARKKAPQAVFHWGKHGVAVKVGLTVAGVALIGFLGLPPLLDLLSMPAAYSKLWQYAIFGGLFIPAMAIPAMLLIEGLAGKRLWCRFVCPQSVLLSLIHRLAPWGLRVAFEAKRCSCPATKPRCVAACHLGLDPRRGKGPSPACINCGDCLTACRQAGGALRFRLGRREKNLSGQEDSTTAGRQL